MSSSDEILQRSSKKRIKIEKWKYDRVTGNCIEHRVTEKSVPHTSFSIVCYHFQKAWKRTKRRLRSRVPVCNSLAKWRRRRITAKATFRRPEENAVKDDIDNASTDVYLIPHRSCGKKGFVEYLLRKCRISRCYVPLIDCRHESESFLLSDNDDIPNRSFERTRSPTNLRTGSASSGESNPVQSGQGEPELVATSETSKKSTDTVKTSEQQLADIVYDESNNCENFERSKANEIRETKKCSKKGNKTDIPRVKVTKKRLEIESFYNNAHRKQNEEETEVKELYDSFNMKEKTANIKDSVTNDKNKHSRSGKTKNAKRLKRLSFREEFVDLTDVVCESSTVEKVMYESGILNYRYLINSTPPQSAENKFIKSRVIVVVLGTKESIFNLKLLLEYHKDIRCNRKTTEPNSGIKSNQNDTRSSKSETVNIDLDLRGENCCLVEQDVSNSTVDDRLSDVETMSTTSLKGSTLERKKTTHAADKYLSKKFKVVGGTLVSEDLSKRHLSENNISTKHAERSGIRSPKGDNIKVGDLLDNVEQLENYDSGSASSTDCKLACHSDSTDSNNGESSQPLGLREEGIDLNKYQSGPFDIQKGSSDLRSNLKVKDRKNLNSKIGLVDDCGGKQAGTIKDSTAKDSSLKFSGLIRRKCQPLPQRVFVDNLEDKVDNGENSGADTGESEVDTAESDSDGENETKIF